MLRDQLLDLPGVDPVTAGLADLGRGAATIPALLVSIGAPRLSALLTQRYLVRRAGWSSFERIPP